MAAEAELGAIAQAALDEYVAYFTGVQRPGTIPAAREQRLAALQARNVRGALNETRIASLFALTPSQARALLAGTRARYRHTTERALAAAVADSLGGTRSGKLQDGNVWFRCSPSLVALMRDILANAQQGLPPIRASTRTAQTYLTHEDTLRYVCEELGVDTGTIAALQ
jgi:hypothetical protein